MSVCTGRWWLAAAMLALGGVPQARAQTIDGQPRDWRSMILDDRADVRPDGRPDLDIYAFNHAVTEVRCQDFWPGPPLHVCWAVEMAFIVRFGAPVFQDSTESVVEIALDIDPSRDAGDPGGFWQEVAAEPYHDELTRFRPDLRYAITGASGGMTCATGARFAGGEDGAWVEDEDAIVEVAVDGAYVECRVRVPWPQGDPASGLTPRTYIAFVSRSGERRDYALVMQGIVTGVEPGTWAGLKRRRTR